MRKYKFKELREMEQRERNRLRAKRNKLANQYMNYAMAGMAVVLFALIFLIIRNILP